VPKYREPTRLDLPVGDTQAIVTPLADTVIVEWLGRRVEVTMTMTPEAADNLMRTLHDAICKDCQPEA
jgi:hypothetical protein